METSGSVDSIDFSKLKVPELKKELKARGLSTSGNKNELLERLQQFASKLKADDNGNASISESVDELEEDLLNDDDDEHLDGGDTVLADIDSTLDVSHVQKPQKRPSEGSTQETDGDQPKAKKLVLNRTPSGNSEAQTNGSSTKSNTTEKNETSENAEGKKVIKLSELGAKERLELRAKKFGVSAAVDVKRAARAERFGLSTLTSSTGKISLTNPTASLDTLKQRAQRFGGSVSSVMSKLEEQERLEKRKARFGSLESTNGTTNQNDKAKQRLERFKQR